MKIEEGGVYRDREGGKHGPLEKGEQWPNGPWLFRAGSDYYDVKGCSFNRMSKQDYEPWLVSLCQDEVPSPIQSKRHIVTGEYGRVKIVAHGSGGMIEGYDRWVSLRFDSPDWNASELRAAALTFTQLADFLEEQGK